MLKAFTTWWRFRRYSIDTETNVRVLLAPLSQDTLSTILRSTPGFRVAVRQHFDSSTPPRRASVYITASLLAHLVESHLSPDQRKSALTELQTRLDGASDPDQSTVLVSCIVWAHNGAYKWVSQGDVDRREAALIADEAVGSLKGWTADTRSHSRLVDDLRDILNSPRH